MMNLSKDGRVVARDVDVTPPGALKAAVKDAFPTASHVFSVGS